MPFAVLAYTKRSSIQSSTILQAKKFKTVYYSVFSYGGVEEVQRKAK